MNTCKQQSINSFMTQVFLRTETSPLICSANQWAGFCNRGLRHKRFKMLFIHIHRESALTYCKAQFAFFVLVFFSVFFFSKISTIHRTSGEGGDYLLIFFQTLPSASQTLRHQLGYCCRELCTQLAAGIAHEIFGTRFLELTFLHLHQQLFMLRECLKLG